ncbi:hypothetical protein N5U04_09825 [Aliarcobacter butzleri]|uniref:hypothetical protein n=1 Tax=Aliarcobacter butzleri TaxID=28197 RepID=UPI0021B42C1B|nr:hypothetical protein [Aliarcobacter butzleri]MCT7549824.1 hypothetical protein [Aliarcobacter butzleri]MCT7559866.1 hypothetical protein [Aliarcobacter butzleri]
MTDREKLLAEAVAVGLILGTDFEKNISNVNLQKKIEEKKAENEAELEDVDLETPPTVEELKDMEIAVQMHNDESNTKDKEPNDGVDNTDKNPDENNDLGDKETNLQKKIDELQEEDEQEEDTLIKRVSKCGNYRVKIKGLEETARRSGVTIEDLKSVLGTGKLLNNFTFEIA